ncbi:hypothetical protein IQ273_02260 [Nodosilinea sp. LEGE 07298]|uniref:hypothetical protein n=1 Tax=Nodosilinea sp. LEGE 07298 TaxID=2777970 RepID=UPI001880BB39|nr:hypothetical protein [Nodosilinea sp. LEGE 07298]MBE9108245.1 hypothetical protein [Nodosilinea sp. LEGE 07298]
MSYDFDPNSEYKKTDIEALTGLSANTVSESLKTAGLSTSRRIYSGAELLERFVPVRQMLEAGRTHEEIREAFEMRQAGSSSDGVGRPRQGGAYHRSQAPSSSSSSIGANEAVSGEMGSFEDEINAAIKESIESVVHAATQDIVKYIPAMVAASLAEAAQSGKIRDAFHSTLREYFAQRRSAEFALDAVETKAFPITEDGSDEEGDRVEEGQDDENENDGDVWANQE